MENLLLILVLTLNVIISFWNCYAVGSAWKDTMTFGGVFNKLLLWSGIIQSGVGFSMTILLSLTYISSIFLTSGEKPYLSPVEAKQMFQYVFSLWYVAVIFPIIGSGLAIWAHSLRLAYKNKDFASIANAGWNTYAQINNTVSAFNNFGGAFGKVSELIGDVFESKDDSKGKLGAIVLLLVIISISLGFIISFCLVRYFANSTYSRIEQYGDNQFKYKR